MCCACISHPLLAFFFHRAVLLLVQLFFQFVDTLVAFFDDALGGDGFAALVFQLGLQFLAFLAVFGGHVGNEVNDGLLVARRDLNLADDDLLVGGIELAQFAQFLRGHAQRGRLVQRFFAEQAEVLQLFVHRLPAAADCGTKSVPCVEADFGAVNNHRLPGQLFVALAFLDLRQLHQRKGFKQGRNGLCCLNAP